MQRLQSLKSLPQLNTGKLTIKRKIFGSVILLFDELHLSVHKPTDFF